MPLHVDREGRTGPARPGPAQRPRPGGYAPNNVDHLIRSAKLRSAAARTRTEAVLDSSDAAVRVASVVGLARAAQVSRSWLYSQPDLIQKFTATMATPHAARREPTAASDPSLLKRLELAHQRISELTDGNRQLRRQLEAAYGQLRAART